MGIVRTRLNEQIPPPMAVVEGHPSAEDSNRYSQHSIETLVVVLAVIAIVGVMAGILARLCGGRHLGGSGEADIEGWVERRCRSCIDGGISVQDHHSKPPPDQADKK